MKKNLLLLWLLLAFVPSAFAQDPYAALTTVPAFPKPGEKVTFTYDASRTELANEEVEAIAYLYHGKDLQPLDIPLKKTGKGWQGEVPTTPGSTGYYLFFKNPDLQDNNGGKGYSYFLYDHAQKPVSGAYAAWAAAQYDWVSVMGLDRDAVAILTHYEKEFSRNPQLKRQYMANYLQALLQQKNGNGPDQAKREIEAFAQLPDLTADEMIIIASFYRSSRQPEKVTEWLTRSKEKEPKGRLVAQERVALAYQTEDLSQRATQLAELVGEFPDHRDMMNQTMRSLAFAMVKQGQYDEFEALLIKNPEVELWYLYNNVAYDMGKAGENLPRASKIGEKGYIRAQNELADPNALRPRTMTPKQWYQQRQQNLGEATDTWATILLLEGKHKKALPLLEEAARLQQGRTIETNERHVEALIKNNRQAQARKALETYIATGHSNAKMKDYLRELYVRQHGSEKGYPAYAQRLEAPALEKMRAQLRKKLISDPAPDFVLHDLTGKQVSLADLRGKTVIVDFWATWCGPCIQSFPSMQQAVDKYKTDDKVAFVFINSWENGDDKKQVVQDFLTKRKFTFDVLLDTENKTIADFKVEGIPTKFIIDKEGQVRYKGVGFGGNGDGAVTEISMLIDMLK